MEKKLPEKLKPIAESWKPGENTILYIEMKDGSITTLVLGSKHSIKAALYELITNIADKLDMGFADLLCEMFNFRIGDLAAYDGCRERKYIENDISLLNELMGDKDETEENH